jgi:hypothetical protein
VRYFFTVLTLFSFFLDTTYTAESGDETYKHKSYAFGLAHQFTSYLYLVDTSTFTLIELN